MLLLNVEIMAGNAETVSVQNRPVQNRPFITDHSKQTTFITDPFITDPFITDYVHNRPRS